MMSVSQLVRIDLHHIDICGINRLTNVATVSNNFFMSYVKSMANSSSLSRTMPIDAQMCVTSLPVTLTNVHYVNKNSSGDEIANVNFCTTTTYM